MNRCPVCFYPDMPYPAADYDICPCCATEFGNDDALYTHEHLRRVWIAKGYPWFYGDPPPNWNPIQQLLMAGYGYGISPASETTWVVDTIGDYKLKSTDDTSDLVGEMVA